MPGSSINQAIAAFFAPPPPPPCLWAADISGGSCHKSRGGTAAAALQWNIGRVQRPRQPPPSTNACNFCQPSYCRVFAPPPRPHACGLQTSAAAAATNPEAAQQLLHYSGTLVAYKDPVNPHLALMPAISINQAIDVFIIHPPPPCLWPADISGGGCYRSKGSTAVLALQWNIGRI